MYCEAVRCCAAHLCRGDGLAAPPLLPLSRPFAFVLPAGGAEQLRYMEMPSDAGRALLLAAAAAAAGLEFAAAGLPLRAGSWARRLCVAAASSSVLTAVLAGGCACRSGIEGLGDMLQSHCDCSAHPDSCDQSICYRMPLARGERTNLPADV